MHNADENSNRDNSARPSRKLYQNKCSDPISIQSTIQSTSQTISLRIGTKKNDTIGHSFTRKVEEREASLALNYAYTNDFFEEHHITSHQFNVESQHEVPGLLIPMNAWECMIRRIKCTYYTSYKSTIPQSIRSSQVDTLLVQFVMFALKLILDDCTFVHVTRKCVLADSLVGAHYTHARQGRL